jgi:hypothetical protein
MFYLSIQLGIIIPTDELIFFRGVETADTCSYPMLFSKHVSFHVGLTCPCMVATKTQALD